MVLKTGEHRLECEDLKGSLIQMTICSFDLIFKLEMDTSNNGHNTDGTVCS